MNRLKSQSIVTAKEYLKVKGINFKAPKIIIISYNSKLDLNNFKLIEKWHRGQLYSNGKIGILINLGIGSSAINLATEELFVLGTKEFIILGYAGGLNPKLKSGQVINSEKNKIYSTNDPYQEENNIWFDKMQKEKYDAVDMETEYLKIKSTKLGFNAISYLIVIDILSRKGWKKEADLEKIQKSFKLTFNKILKDLLV